GTIRGGHRPREQDLSRLRKLIRIPRVGARILHPGAIWAASGGFLCLGVVAVGEAADRIPRRLTPSPQAAQACTPRPGGTRVIRPKTGSSLLKETGACSPREKRSKSQCQGDRKTKTGACLI